MSREDLIAKLRAASEAIERFLRRDLMRGGIAEPQTKQSLEQLLVTLQGARHYLAPDRPKRAPQPGDPAEPVRGWDQSATMKIRMDDD